MEKKPSKLKVRIIVRKEEYGTLSHGGHPGKIWKGGDYDCSEGG